jgi:hypothetical protein
MAQNQNTVGSFIPTTNTWDVSDVYQANLDEKLEKLLVRLYQNLNIMSLNVNLKDTGYYNTQPFVNGQLFFPLPGVNSANASGLVATYRQVFRKVINFGALPNAATKSVAHGIPFNAAFTTTRIYACSSDTTNLDYVPIPYASATNDNIELNLDGTNVNITTNSASWVTFTITYVIIEYLTQ